MKRYMVYVKDKFDKSYETLKEAREVARNLKKVYEELEQCATIQIYKNELLNEEIIQAEEEF